MSDPAATAFWSLLCHVVQGHFATIQGSFIREAQNCWNWLSFHVPFLWSSCNMYINGTDSCMYSTHTHTHRSGRCTMTRWTRETHRWTLLGQEGPNFWHAGHGNAFEVLAAVHRLFCLRAVWLRRRAPQPQDGPCGPVGASWPGALAAFENYLTKDLQLTTKDLEGPRETWRDLEGRVLLSCSQNRSKKNIPAPSLLDAFFFFQYLKNHSNKLFKLSMVEFSWSFWCLHPSWLRCFLGVGQDVGTINAMVAWWTVLGALLSSLNRWKLLMVFPS